MNFENQSMNESFDMLPIEVIDGFEEGDSILIETESKDGQEIKESFDSLENARNFILTDNRYNPEILKIKLIKANEKE